MTKVMLMCYTPDERLETAFAEGTALGYDCVFCGETPHEGGEAFSARYVAEWADTEKLVAIAEKERIDGVVALCDKAVVPAAKVARALGLPGNPPESLEPFTSKYSCRELQRRAGVFCPGFFIFKSAEGIREKCASLRLPVIVKPLQGASSFGQTVLRRIDDLPAAFDEASRNSRAAGLSWRNLSRMKNCAS